MRTCVSRGVQAAYICRWLYALRTAGRSLGALSPAAAAARPQCTLSALVGVQKSLKTQLAGLEGLRQDPRLGDRRAARSA